MSINLVITPGTVPFGTPLPANAQALVNFSAQYLGIEGDEFITFLNFGSATPSPEMRGYPWFKTDTDGNPIGLYAWNGSDWIATPQITPSGPTSGRPINPAVGTKFLDTTINVELMYERGQWRTAAGSPGDIKYVSAIDLDTAVQYNPGWQQFDAAVGRVIGGAGEGSGLTARSVGESIGEEDHILAINELPSHTHTTPVGGNAIQADGNAANPAGIISGVSAGVTGATGSDVGHNNMQPTIFMWVLAKQ